mmetsp:Transcript_45321/g.114020  ORF Transcript_45321/g.114020 Transcript_45321/m.114020 type:complete len:212 (+) Transcript_45321:1031-1666(+)
MSSPGTASYSGASMGPRFFNTSSLEVATWPKIPSMPFWTVAMKPPSLDGTISVWIESLAGIALATPRFKNSPKPFPIVVSSSLAGLGVLWLGRRCDRCRWTPGGGEDLFGAMSQAFSEAHGGSPGICMPETSWLKSGILDENSSGGLDLVRELQGLPNCCAACGAPRERIRTTGGSTLREPELRGSGWFLNISCSLNGFANMLADRSWDVG